MCKHCQLIHVHHHGACTTLSVLGTGKFHKLWIQPATLFPLSGPSSVEWSSCLALATDGGHSVLECIVLASCHGGVLEGQLLFLHGMLQSLYHARLASGQACCSV